MLGIINEAAKSGQYTCYMPCNCDTYNYLHFITCKFAIGASSNSAIKNMISNIYTQGAIIQID